MLCTTSVVSATSTLNTTSLLRTHMEESSVVDVVSSDEEGEEDDSVAAGSLAPRLLRKVSTMRELGTVVSLKEGYLLKQGRSFQRWRTRYFKLKGRKLFYAATAESPVYNEIDLTDLSVAECGSKNANSFQIICSTTSCVLCADTRKDMEEWLLAFKTSASHHFYESGAEHLRCATSGDHTWFVCSHSRPTYCNLCKEALSGMAWNGLSCEVCKLKSHKRCGVKVTQPCKWTTLDSMAHMAPQGSDFTPHQWLEGNLPMSAKCAVCERTCGSVLRLQDFRCLWCRQVVHASCLQNHPRQCLLGPARLSVLPPVSIKGVQLDGHAQLTQHHSFAGSPLLVFVNSKSGDNQGVKVLRKFKRLLNPAQVFDLMNGGPEFGLRLFQMFESFRVVVCGGDGSVTWVFTALDRLNLHHKCQVGILPLGTGNDLARVLGWGHNLEDDAQLPHILDRFERAHTNMLDRWSVMIYEGSPAPIIKHKSSITRYEHSVADHLKQILWSEDNTAVIASARVLCETVKDFVAKVGEAYKLEEQQSTSYADETMSSKCTVLEQKLQGLLKTLQAEEIRAEAAETSGIEPEGSSSDSVPEMTPKLNKRQFIEKEAVMNRANSLKKVIRQIIEHAEHAVDEQQNLPIVHARSKSKRRRKWGQAKAKTLPNLPSPNMDTPSTSGVGRLATLRRPLRISDSDSTVPDDPSEALRSVHKIPYPAVVICDNKLADDSVVDSSTTPGFMTSDDEQITAFHHPTRLMDLPTPMHNSISSLSLTEADEGLGVGSRKLSHGTRMQHSDNANLWPPSPPGLVPSPASSSGVVAEVLLLNADVLGVAASPLMDFEHIPPAEFKEAKVMSNYFGIGLDAKIALEFQQKRDGYGDKARSRSKLLMWYGMLGTKELLARTYKNLEQRVHVECDGHRIQLPSLQGLVVLNIPSYQGGTNFWGTSKAGGTFLEQSYDDRILEVVAVFSVMHCATSRVTSKVIRLQNHRIAQCREVKIIITGDEPIPVQVDGEPWMQAPAYIHIKHKNRAQVLVRNRQFEATLRTWAERQARLQQHPPLCLLALFTEQESIDIVAFIETVRRWSLLVRRLCNESSALQNQVENAMEHLEQNLNLVYPPATKLAQRPHVHMILSNVVSVVRELVSHIEAYLSGDTAVCSQSAMLSEHSCNALAQEGVTVQDGARHISKILAFSHSSNSLPQSSSGLLWRGIRSRVSNPGVAATSTSTTSADVLCSNKTVVTSHKSSKFSLTQWIRSTTNKLSKHKHRPLTKSQSQGAVDWSSIQVADWMKSVGLDEFVHIFCHHDIKGAELMRLERRDLKEMGIGKLGHMKRIERAIQNLSQSTE